MVECLLHTQEVASSNLASPMNRLYTLRSRIKNHPDFIDLTETNFHRAGFRFPPGDLKRGASAYFDNASYDPDPQGLLPAREAIAAYHNSRGHSVDAAHIVITASTSESYGTIFSALFEADDTVLLPSPSYPLFEEVARYHGVSCAFYPMRRSPDGWSIDGDMVAGMIADLQARAVVLISPNNPTGMVADQKTIDALADATCALGDDHYLVIDEVFSEFADVPVPAPENPTCPVLYLNGASKTFASPDLKTAWIAVQGPTVAPRDGAGATAVAGDGDAERSTVAGGSASSAADIVDRLTTVTDTYLNSSSLSQFLVPTLFGRLDWCRQNIAAPVAARRKALKRIAAEHPELGISTPAGGIHATLSPDVVPAPRGPQRAGGLGSAGSATSTGGTRPGTAGGAGPRTIAAASTGSTAQGGPVDDEALALAILEHTHVFLHPGYLYGWEQDAILVMSYLGDAAKTAEALDRVGACLASLNG